MRHPLLHVPPFWAAEKIKKMIHYCVFLCKSKELFFSSGLVKFLFQRLGSVSPIADLDVFCFFFGLWYAHGGGEPGQQNLPSHPPSASEKMCLMAGLLKKFHLPKQHSSI